MQIRSPLNVPTPRRGAMSQGCMIGLGIGAFIVVVLLIGVMLGVGRYNGLASGKLNAEAKWAEIDSQYKRRYDLIPNLVETVKGAANFEKSTLQAVTEARASVGKAALPANVPTDQAQLNAYIQAQQGLSGALGRLFSVAENYPQLKATENFRSLQDQIEGTENRIAVARRDYIEAVKSYNISTATFPSSVIAGMFHFAPLPQPQSAPEERVNPKVDFGNSPK